MKKQLNEASITSELREGSVFFRREQASPLPDKNNKPVDAPEEAKSAAHEYTERSERTVAPNARTVQSNEREEEPAESLEHKERSVMHELEQGVQERKRPTERYSFEIYTDQKGQIEELQYRYKKRVGKNLAASRIVREALNEYLERALGAL